MLERATVLVVFALVGAGMNWGCASKIVPEKSTGTNWIDCESDADCRLVEGARCGNEGVCVDRHGNKISATAVGTEGGTTFSEGGGSEGGSAGACGCGPALIYGLTVAVQAPDSGQPVCDATVIARDGDYEEELVEQMTQDFACRYVGAANRPGTYTITVGHPRLESVTSGPIEVEVACGCPVAQDVEISSQGLCYPIVAAPFDVERSCFTGDVTLKGACLREQAPTTTMGTGMRGCLIAPDGSVYVAFVGYTQRLEGEGWSGEGADGLPVYDPVTPACVEALAAFGADSSARPSCAAVDAGP